MTGQAEWVVTTKVRVVVADENALLAAAREAGGDAASVQSALQTIVRPPDVTSLPGLAGRADITWHASVHAEPDDPQPGR
jgi:hypothetical protein